MAKHVRFALVLLLALLAGMIAWQSLRVREPHYEGKALSVWLKEYDHRLRNLSPAVHGRRSTVSADMAIRAVGTNAIPFLLQRLRACDSPLQIRLRTLARKIPFFDSRVRTAIDLRREGANGFIALGKLGNSAVPQLAEMLSEKTDPSIARTAIHVLEKFEDDVVLGPLIAATTNIDPVVRSAALVDLGNRRSNTNGVVRAVLNALSDSDPSVRCSAALALSKFTDQAEVILPALVTALHDSSSSVQDMAAQSIGRFGVKAIAAVPALVQLVKDKGTASPAAGALQKIDPAAAHDAGIPTLPAPASFE